MSVFGFIDVLIFYEHKQVLKLLVDMYALLNVYKYFFAENLTGMYDLYYT